MDEYIQMLEMQLRFAEEERQQAVEAAYESGKEESIMQRENIKTILKFYSQIDGSHHKAWCLDQIARIVYGNEYEKFVHDYMYVDDDGVEHDDILYEWDYGIAP